MADLIETIRKASQSCTVITQTIYDLTVSAMSMRGQKPLVVGDDYVLLFTLQDNAGVAINITGAVIRFTAKYKYADLDTSAIIQKTATLVTPVSGIFSITIAKTDVTSLYLVRGVYDIQMTLSGVVSTILTGAIEFMQDVTKTS